jgi:hypothetical protein
MGLLDDAIREHLELKRARGADPTEVERLEREALGPVRRERGLGAPQVEVHEEYDVARLTGEEPTSYHDSSAPHEDQADSAPPLNLAGAHEPQNGHAVEEDDAPPKRRGFLRRRPAPEPEAVQAHHEEPEYLEGTVLFDSVHDEPLDDDDPLLHAEPLHHDEPSQYEQPLPHDEPSLRDEPLPQAAPLPQTEEPEHAEIPVQQPPPLAFEAPPERPRFTAEPPTTIQPVHIDDEEPVEPPPAPSDLHQAPDAPGTEPAQDRVEPTPPPVAPQPAHAEPQPTREFDVLGETAPEAEPEEDVLEETPEFLQDTPEHDRLWFEQRPPRDFDFDG